MHAALLWVLLQTPADAPAIPPTGIVLPKGPAAIAFASVTPETAPAKLELKPLPSWPDGSGWNETATWVAWADDVRAEARAEHADPARRARLCAFARAQNRSDDAWEHFAALAKEPSWCAALLPQLMPGVPADAPPTERGGMAAPLRDGVVLTPALPPPSRPAREVLLGLPWIERREMRIEGLRVGDATLAMRVALESDGIQVDFDHRSGGTVHVSVVLPEPPDFEIGVAYVDWMRQDTVGGPLTLEIAPETETHTLFGRLQQRSMPWPTRLPSARIAGLERDGLRLEIGPSDPGAPRITAFAAGLARVLELPCALRVRDAAIEPFGGIEVGLILGPERERKLAGLTSLTERYAMGPRLSTPPGGKGR